MIPMEEIVMSPVEAFANGIKMQSSDRVDQEIKVAPNDKN